MEDNFFWFFTQDSDKFIIVSFNDTFSMAAAYFAEEQAYDVSIDIRLIP